MISSSILLDVIASESLLFGPHQHHDEPTQMIVSKGFPCFSLKAQRGCTLANDVSTCTIVKQFPLPPLTWLMYTYKNPISGKRGFILKKGCTHQLKNVNTCIIYNLVDNTANPCRAAKEKRGLLMYDHYQTLGTVS